MLRKLAWSRGARLGGLAIALAATLGASDVSQHDRFDTVVIDPGHGGQDSGARGPTGVLEKDLVLGVSRDLAKRLRARGLRVVMTRDTDVFVPLELRTAIANDARGDLFLSIHANATEDTEVSGSETYFLALDASDADAAEVAARENRAFAVAEEADIDVVRDPFIALLGDLIATEYLRESSEAAQLIQTELASVGALRSRGVKQALFVVLAGVQMPAALVEKAEFGKTGEVYLLNREGIYQTTPRFHGRIMEKSRYDDISEHAGIRTSEEEAGLRNGREIPRRVMRSGGMSISGLSLKMTRPSSMV